MALPTMRRYAWLALAFGLLVSLPQVADALSLELRGGSGDIGMPRGDSAPKDRKPNANGSYDQADAVLVFSQWKRTDLFVGAEYSVSDDGRQDFGYPLTGTMKYSSRVAAAVFGIRWKPVALNRFQIYFALSGLAGKSRYRADFSSRPELVPLSDPEGGSSFLRPRVGVGTAFLFTDRWGIGFEFAYTASGPSYTMQVRNTDSGQNEYRKINDSAETFGYTLALRYFFGK